MRDWVVQRWGQAVLDATGGVDRRKVAEIVFADPMELRALEGQVFPWIRQRMQEMVAAAATDNQVRLIVLDAAVMLEAGWDELCDRMVYVHAPREVCLQRITQGRGWSIKEVENRENVQMSLTEKASRAGEVLLNVGSPAELEAQVKGLLCRWGHSRRGHPEERG